MQPNLRTSEARAEFSGRQLQAARQNVSLTTWLGGENHAETGVLLTNAWGRGVLSPGSLAGGGTCHIIFHPLSLGSGRKIEDLP